MNKHLKSALIHAWIIAISVIPTIIPQIYDALVLYVQPEIATVITLFLWTFIKKYLDDKTERKSDS